MRVRGLSWEDVKPTRSSRKKAAVPEGQMFFQDVLSKVDDKDHIRKPKNSKSLPGFFAALVQAEYLCYDHL